MSANENGSLREKVEFPLNEPVILKLDYNDGTISSGRFGDQYQYTFDGSTRIAWLDPEVRALILKTGAKAGDEIAIARREVKGPRGRKRVSWEVEKVEEEANPADEANAAYNAESAAREARDTRTAPPARSAPQSAPRPAAAPVAPSAPRAPEQIPLNNARQEFTLRSARLFADCIAAAIHAAALSEDEAADHKIPLQWEQDDIRAMATTIYINAAGGRK